MSVRRRNSVARGFSLVEVLMAIFILGIGVISIAALFPAGIAQQRQSVDDIMGPIVAENAIAVLRSKLDQGDFGTFEDFGTNDPRRFTVLGDWGWLRPGFSFDTPRIDIFSADATATEFPAGVGTPSLNGLPWNRLRYGDVTPEFVVTQQERSYPMASAARPQYVWECMFRRFQGRVLVAIFVYRATAPGGENASYAVQPDPSNDFPPLPVAVELGDAAGWDAWGADDVEGTADDALVEGTSTWGGYDVEQRNLAWQESGQWILDQNNNVHRVLSTYRDVDDNRAVELVRPVPVMAPLAAFSSAAPGDGIHNIVSDIWYLPLVTRDSANEFRLTPVYVTVKEL
ncbi:MAG: prepilin-type N-terminal cleavage/methylation domain-containing protein [Phycisphaerales bacterium]|nr:prepilin-type N-terminal cleavage/methylation domain-containing protein [Phycisphaerales bacterium]NNM25710.1 prepilin-type N-terminal cleavage/methylation domain-containing protein [Phycisphaerales bacterium]